MDKKFKEILKKVWVWCKGKKTYAVGVCAIVYGIYAKSPDALILGFGLLGLRNGLAGEVAKILLNPQGITPQI